MEHAKKMVIIPQEFMDNMRHPVMSAPSTSLSQLDQDMQVILNLKGLSDDEKWNRYSIVLQKFLSITRKQRQPVSLPITESTEKLTDMKEEILAATPSMYRRKAELLYERLLHNSNIDWDKYGAVFINNNKIEGSNIVDLVSDIIRPRKTSNPVGWQLFNRALALSNIPQEYIGNPRRQEFIQQIVFGNPGRHVPLSGANQEEAQELTEAEEEEEEEKEPISFVSSFPGHKRKRTVPVWSRYKP